MNAIETHYNGYKFRSRLEARWAVFFDSLGVKYQYEKEGYDLGDLGGYLPDFYIPSANLHVEIKPKMPQAKELDKLMAFHVKLQEHWAQQTIHHVYSACEHEQDPTETFNLLVGSPYVDTTPRMDYGIYGMTPNWEEPTCFLGLWAICWICGHLTSTRVWNDGEPLRYYCQYCDLIGRPSDEECNKLQCEFHKGDILTPHNPYLHPRLIIAYHQASTARFEHGESPCIGHVKETPIYL
jgi:hypothetical protein